MKKEIIRRGVIGFIAGISIGYVTSILVSLLIGEGTYQPCVPDFVEAMGSEINAVIIQTILSGLLGSSFAASSIIWDIDSWSLVKQTGLYFLMNSIMMFPIAYFLYWMDHSIRGFFSYFMIFIVIFIIIWMVGYLKAKYNVKKNE